MRCFYCAEEIRDEAVVCRYCQSDVHYARGLLAKIAALEEKLQQGVPAAIVAPAPRSAQRAAKWLPGLTCAVISLAIWKDVGSDDDRRAFIGLGAVLLFGLIQGSWWQGRHFRAYLFWGAVAGLAIYLPDAQANVADRQVGMLLFVEILSMLLYVTGGLIGDFFERLLNPEAVRPGLADRVAQKISGSGSTSDEGIKRLAAAISALAPILTLAGSIIVALIGKR